MANNHWYSCRFITVEVTTEPGYRQNLNSRTPSFRFGTGHIFNSVFDSNADGINTRDGRPFYILQSTVLFNISFQVLNYSSRIVYGPTQRRQLRAQTKGLLFPKGIYSMEQRTQRPTERLQTHLTVLLFWTQRM